MLRAYAAALEGALETLDANGHMILSGGEAVKRIRAEADDLDLKAAHHPTREPPEQGLDNLRGPSDSSPCGRRSLTRPGVVKNL